MTHTLPALPDPLPGSRPPPAADLVSRLYLEAAAPVRARMLAALLRPLSPLALVAVAAGAFGRFLGPRGADGLRVAAEDVVRYSAEQIGELARFVEQVSPEALLQAAGLVTSTPVQAAAAGVAVLLLQARREPLRRAEAPGPALRADRTDLGDRADRGDRAAGPSTGH